MSILSYLFAILAGSANPAQAGANAELNKGLASPIWSACFVYSSGLAGILLVQVVLRQTWPGRVDHIPWWAWIGGLLSIGSTVGGLTLAQRMGSGVFTGLSLTASMLTSIALDQFGLFGFKEHPASPLRMVGAGLMVGGIWLIARF